jgi:MFS family permease
LLIIDVQSYGVFLGYYLENGIYPAATPTDFAFIGGLNFSVAMLASPAVTVLVRRNPYGVRLPMLIGVCLQTTGFITASFATRIWHLYLTQGVLVGLGVGFTYIPSIAVLSQWFHRRRSLANGISAAGSGIGGLLFSFMVRAAISNTSLAWSLRITGLVSCFMNILATVAIRSRNHIIQPKQHLFDMDLLYRYDVLLVLIWSFLSMLGYITLLFSMSNFASSIGLDESQAANTTAFLNLGTALGRPFIGVVSDYFGRIQAAGFITLLCALSVFAIWIPATSYGVTILFVIVNGAILGIFWVVSYLQLENHTLD